MARLLFKTIVIGFSAALVATGLFGKEELFRFLAPTQPVEAEVLVIEGWIGEHALQQAVDEIRRQNYQKILVTTIAYDPVFRVHSQGALTFRLYQLQNPLTEFQQIRIKAYGDPAGGIQAYARILVDTVEVGEFTTTHEPEWYTISLSQSIEADSIIIVYDNDQIIDEEDRDLYVYSIQVDSTEIPVRHPAVGYDRGKLDGKKVYRTDYRSEADESAEFIINQGVDPELVQALTAPMVNFERTYTAALEVKKWLPDSIRAINVFSESVHVRRSQLVYQRMLGDSVRVGAIASKSENRQPEHWWKESGSRNYVLLQLAKYLYANVFVFHHPE
mgnify:CR=1 FL=1